MKKFGLIGRKLSHSFSQSYFTEKFKALNLPDHVYQLIELEKIDEVKKVLEEKDLIGLNVTVPYKESIIPFLSNLHESALKVGAVNVVKVNNGMSTGYNSDYLGFKNSLINWLPKNFKGKSLILGSGGASKAVQATLSDMDIEYHVVSRSPAVNELSYKEANDIISSKVSLVVNTTPLGMSPNVETYPAIDYILLTDEHYLYDLVYNPEITAFLTKGKSRGASTKNGLEMLHLQAEESWKIWTEYGV